MTFDDILQPISPSFSFILTYATKELLYSFFIFAFPLLYRRTIYICRPTLTTFDDILQPISPRIDATKESYRILFYFILFTVGGCSCCIKYA
ncbi:hypothetical protein EV363DRAFT_1173021 [Boletus edulis]|nr:hypothetical protein EV363DRAFT_1173021 [Boletus edulis]